MHYYAKFKPEDGGYVVTFPDCPGCVTEGDTRKEALANASEALEGWLETHLERGAVPPRPSCKTGTRVDVPIELSIAIQIRQVREDRGLTQTAAAKLMGVSQQQFAKLERPTSNPTITTLVTAARALAIDFEVIFGPAANDNRVPDSARAKSPRKKLA